MLQTPFHAYYKARLLEQLPEEEQFIPVFASSDIEIYPFQIAAASFALRSPYQKGAVLCDEAGMGKSHEAMVDFTNENLRVLFPKKLPPEEITEVWIPYANLAHALLDLVNRKAIKPTQKIRIVATDTTAGEYRSEWKFTPNDFINQYIKK